MELEGRQPQDQLAAGHDQDVREDEDRDASPGGRHGAHRRTGVQRSDTG